MITYLLFNSVRFTSGKIRKEALVSNDNGDLALSMMSDNLITGSGGGLRQNYRGKPLQSPTLPAVAGGGKIAKKRISGAVGRPKGSGKAQASGNLASGATGANAGSTAYNRKAKVAPEFGRKRGPKPKMRGVFGAPGVGLQRPQSDTNNGRSIC